MSVPAAYAGIILIWATTPLAIKWSGQGPGPLFGVTARMALSAALCVLLLGLLRARLPLRRDAVLTYLAGGIGLYVAMTSVYWGALYIPSGLISVIYGMTPLMTSLLAFWLLGERSVTATKISAVLLGIAGLAVVFRGSLTLHGTALYGIAAVLVSTFFHSLSAVLIKRIAAPVSSIALTTGSLLVALPLYVLTWALLDGTWPQELPERAAYAIVYLAVFGSVLGFVLYYFVLRRISATQAALITLVTPLLALYAGWLFNHEVLPVTVWAGTVMILAGLVIHQWGDRLYP